MLILSLKIIRNSWPTLGCPALFTNAQMMTIFLANYKVVHFRSFECVAQLNLPHMIETPRIEKDHEICIAPF